MPKVSIIIVNYNGHRWLSIFLPTLLKVNYPDYEVIVVDNGSEDESTHYLKLSNFELVKVIELQDNRGFAEATNIGADNATGEILLLLNNDVQVCGDSISEGVLKLLSSQRAAAVQSKIMQYNCRNKIDCIGLSVDKYGVPRAIGNGELDCGQYDHLEEIGAASGGAMFVWKDIFYKVECLDSSFFMYFEDIDLSWRLRRAGYTILSASSSIVYHIGSGSSDITPTSFAPFYWARNFIFCWLKNSSKTSILVFWPAVVLALLLWITFGIMTRRSSVAWGYTRGAFWTVRNMKLVRRHRKSSRIRAGRAGYDSKLFVENIYAEDTNLSYLFGRAKYRALNILREFSFFRL